MVPDNVLLDIFDFYGADRVSVYPCDDFWRTWEWETLIQVCRRWRYVVFGSPRRLDLRLFCTDKTPTRTLLDIWPPFPITITCEYTRWIGIGNVIAALEHHDRVSHVRITFIYGSAFERLVTAMQQPLPTLKNFLLMTNGPSVKVVPETFLGGSAPLLEHFELYGIPFPTLPKFILSSTHLRELSIRNIPHSGYISPNAMVACVAALPNLEVLTIEFGFPVHRTRRVTPPPRTRIVLPAITQLFFRGVSEYFENFIVQIDTPLLDGLNITFFTDLTCDIPRLRHFIARTETLEPLDQVMMDIYDGGILIVSAFPRPRQFWLYIECDTPNWQLSSMVQIFGQQLPFISRVKQLWITESLPSLAKIEWIDNPDAYSSLWLELFHPFIAVQSLHVTGKLVPHAAAALQELTGERTMGVLPALRNLFWGGIRSMLVPEGIKSFVAARQLSGHPVAVNP